MKIYRDGLAVFDVKIGIDTVFTQELMGEHFISNNFIVREPIALILGDYIELGVEKFYLNTAPNIEKLNNFTYRYECRWEAEVYKLYNKILMDEGAADFSYSGTVEDFMLLIQENINSIDPGWAVDYPENTAVKTITFTNESCRIALNKIMDEYGLEYRLVQREIIVRPDVGFNSLYQFEYGRNKGAYRLERNTVIDKNIITRLYAFGAQRNLAFDYREGSRRLVFETGDPAKRYIEANTNLFGVKEGSVNFEDIYPRRTGVISAINAENPNVFTDDGMDFNLLNFLLEGNTAKVVFKSGDLIGNEFELSKYDHGTKTFTLIPTTESNDYTLPNTVVKPAVGDEYTLVDIRMPQSYIDAAEQELLDAALDYLDKHKSPQVTYTLDIDEKYIRKNNVEIACGMRVGVKDVPLGIEESIRISAISFPLVNPQKITATIADNIPNTLTERIIKDTIQSKGEIIKIKKNTYDQYRESIKRFRDFQNEYFDPDGFFDGTKIKPDTIQTGSIAVGSRSQNFGLSGVEIEANFEGDPNRIRISGGQLIHFEIEIEGLGYVWEMDPVIINALNPATRYYIYARCNKSALSGTWVVSTDPITSEQETGWYHFWLGILYPVGENSLRYFMFTKGMTFIVGDTITTGRIKSQDDVNFFDLTQGVFNLGDAENGLDWGVTNEGKLTIRGAIISNAVFAEDGVIQNLRVSSLKTESTGKRIEILADDGGDPATPLHNMKFYDENGNLALTLDTAVDTENSSTPSAGFRIQKHGSSRKGLMSQNGIMSSGSFLTDSDLPTNQHYGSLLGILKEKFFTAFGLRAGVIGMDATDPNAGSPSYGGWFNTILVHGLNIGVKSINANYTASVEDTVISCYNHSPIEIKLPPMPKEGKWLMIRTNFNNPTQISGNGKQIWVKGAVNSIALAGTNYSRWGRMHMLIWDGDYWLYNVAPAIGTE